MDTTPSLLDAIREAVRGPGWAPGRRAEGGRMPSLDGATEWLGSPPLTTEGLRGRVVAVDFWTYTCINWLRTVPYVRAWDEAYAAAGVTRASAPAAVARGEAPGAERAPGLPPAGATAGVR